MRGGTLTIPPGVRVGRFVDLANGESYREAVGYPGSEGMSEEVYTKVSARRASFEGQEFKVSQLLKVVPA